MNLKLLSAVTIFATATTVVFAQKDDLPEADFGRGAKRRTDDQQR